ncbi:MAG: glycosyltransferase family 4 protein [Micavibrio sp.]
MTLPKEARDPENIKILHVVRQYSPAIGGLETYVENMCRTQKDLGYECTVLTLNKLFQEHENGLLKEHETINGVHVRRVSFIGARRYFMPFISPFYFKKFDIVHVHNTDVFYDYIAFCSFFLNFKIFATTHGGFFHTGNFAWIKKLYFHTVTRLSSLAYERIFAISDNDFNVFSRISGKITLLPNAIVPAAKKISHGSDFIYVGRLAQSKEIGLLLDMFACLKGKLDGQYILHIAGPEWDVTIDELRTHAEKIGIGDDVIFHGSMDREKLEALIGRCGYFLSASSYEGFGMAMLEAMGAGLIPYVHANEAFKELTGLSGCGLAVDYHRPEETASRIHEHMRSVSMEDRKRAFDFSRQYSWLSLSEKTHGFYLKALS